MSNSFATLGVSDDIVVALNRAGINEPFPIQAASVADIYAGRDLCGRAPTGSGKTLAFGIPLIEMVKPSGPKRPHALVLAPTRELAEQIKTAIAPFAKIRGARVAAVYGGVGYGGQKSSLRKGVDILVACPGRLLDLMEQDVVRLDRVEAVVVDEADRMADMGFMPEVRKILDQTAKKRQTILFSATLDGEVRQLTKEYQTDPVRHEVGSAKPDMNMMKHHFWTVDSKKRVAVAADVIRRAGPTILFCRTRRICDRVNDQLNEAGLRSATIHGGKSQNARTHALNHFTRGGTHVLVATDVAARGIHVDGVNCVIHYDAPDDDKTYLHRSGRTARAGASGAVVSLVMPDRRGPAKRMIKALSLKSAISAPELEHLPLGEHPEFVPERPKRRTENKRDRKRRSGSADKRDNRVRGPNHDRRPRAGSSSGSGERAGTPDRDRRPRSADTREKRGTDRDRKPRSGSGEKRELRSGDNRDNRDNRDTRDTRDNRDTRDTRDNRDTRDTRDTRDADRDRKPSSGSGGQSRFSKPKSGERVRVARKSARSTGRPGKPNGSSAAGRNEKRAGGPKKHIGGPKRKFSKSA